MIKSNYLFANIYTISISSKRIAVSTSTTLLCSWWSCCQTNFSSTYTCWCRGRDWGWDRSRNRNRGRNGCWYRNWCRNRGRCRNSNAGGWSHRWAGNRATIRQKYTTSSRASCRARSSSTIAGTCVGVQGTAQGPTWEENCQNKILFVISYIDPF